MKPEHLEFQAVVRELQLKFTRFYAHFLSKQNLTFPQFALVSLVYHGGDSSMSSLAKRLMISLPGVSQLVDRLVRDRFVERKAHVKDRRVTLIRITEKGKRAVANTQGKIQKLFLGALGEFKSADQVAIQSFYLKFSARLENQLQQGVRAKPK